MLRKQRNVADYSGDSVPESAMEECLSQAESLLSQIGRWLTENRPDLLE